MAQGTQASCHSRLGAHEAVTAAKLVRKQNAKKTLNWPLRGRALVASKGARTYEMMVRAAECGPLQLWPALCAASGPAARAESDLDGATAVTSSAHT